MKRIEPPRAKATKAKKTKQARARTYHHGNLREALLEEARQIVLVDGTAALTVRELARRAGVSHSAPAHHFGDRRGILAALAARGFEGLAAAMEERAMEAEAARDPRTRLAALGLGYVRFAQREPALMDVMFHPETADPASPHLSATSGRAFELLAEAVRAVVPDVDPAAQADIALASWSLVHGFAALERAGATKRRAAEIGEERTSAATAARLIALLMQAVRPERAVSPKRTPRRPPARPRARKD